MIIDMHVHYGSDADGEKVGLTDLLEQKKKHNLDYIVAFPFNCADLLGDSEQILHLATEYSFIIPFLRFDPRIITPEQLDKALALPYKGVKLHPLSQQFYPDDPAIEWIYPKIAKRNIPLLFHCNTSCYEPMSNPIHMRKVAEKYPDLRVILGHAAGGEIAAIEEVRHCSNIYIETSVDAFPRFFERAQELFQFDRFLFGSDFPYSEIDIELLKIERAKIPPELKQKILYDNAFKVLGL